MSKIIVQKFGGTSVGTVERIQHVARLCLHTQKSESCQLVVVVSAMGDTTDDLIDLIRQITPSPSPREQDMVLSTGEQVSIGLLAMAIHQAGGKAQSLTGWQAGIQTEYSHGKARILEIQTDILKTRLDTGNIVIVAGFQGLAEGQITTLGRGGSDTTAVALAVALGAERCDIYTDVDAVYTTDPRIVSEASRLDEITYDEMLELASQGAQVLHPRSVDTARSHGMTLRVRSSWKPEDPGTLVREKNTMIEKQKEVRGIALDRQQARLSIVGVPDRPGIAWSIFGKLSERGVSVDIIVQCVSHDGLTEVDFTVGRDDAQKAKTELDKIAVEIGARSTSLDKEVVKLSVVGAGMIDKPGIAAKMFRALGDNGINIQMISTSEIRVSCIVSESQGEEAVRVVHDAFELGSEVKLLAN
ncbi:MAG: aspartate kinase [Candidatus Caenarcaniphilales bacterium]|nr:aspartate kinase [Candidatus Caenarcaniphilales bacterium]